MDSIQFESPHIDERYLLGTPGLDELSEELQQTHARYCLFGKTGGPYSRTVYVRGETQFLMDIAADPPLARAIADKLADHLTAIGIEEIRRWGLQQTGIFIYDDMAGNNGPMFHADSFEKVFLPAYRRMISAYKQAGARYVFLHSDGDVRLLLDMLVDAGIDGIHPVERRAGMDMEQLRRRFPKLVLIGGMDNTGTLINGPVEKVRAEARRIIDLGRDGGVIIGTHSISPEIPRDNFIAYHETCLAYGDFA